MRALTVLEAAIASRKARVASAIIVFRDMIRPPLPSLDSALGHQKPLSTEERSGYIIEVRLKMIK
jgi:hypothetical protein